MKYLKFFFLLLVLTAAGCTSTRITHAWNARDAVAKPYKKIVVLAMLSNADELLRQRMEEHLSNDLKALGYNALCSCNEYNPKTFDNMTEDQAIAKLRSLGVDAVISIVLLDKKKDMAYVPPRVIYNPSNNGRNNNFWPYYRSISDRIYVNGYYVEDTEYFWESNLYDLERNKLVYSSQSHSFDPASLENMGHIYGQLVVKNMLEHKVISKQDLKEGK